MSVTLGHHSHVLGFPAIVPGLLSSASFAARLFNASLGHKEFRHPTLPAQSILCHTSQLTYPAGKLGGLNPKPSGGKLQQGVLIAEDTLHGCIAARSCAQVAACQSQEPHVSCYYMQWHVCAPAAACVGKLGMLAR